MGMQEWDPGGGTADRIIFLWANQNLICLETLLRSDMQTDRRMAGEIEGWAGWEG